MNDIRKYVEKSCALIYNHIRIMFKNKAGGAEYEEKPRKNRGYSPNGTLTRYIDYINEATQDFRARYLQTLHWSVLGAIREHTMKIMPKYIMEIILLYQNEGIITEPIMSLEMAANLLAYGIGGSILYQVKEQYQEQEYEVKALLPMLLGASDML